MALTHAHVFLLLSCAPTASAMRPLSLRPATRALYLRRGSAWAQLMRYPGPIARLPLQEMDREVLADASGTLLDCISEASSGAEIEACELAYEELTGMNADERSRPAATPAPAPEAKKPRDLWNQITSLWRAADAPPPPTSPYEKIGVASGELLDCIAAAENGEQIEQCELVFEDEANSSSTTAEKKAR